MSVSWNKVERDVARREGVPLICLAVDSWHLPRGAGQDSKLALSGPAHPEDAALLRAFITELAHRGGSYEEAWNRALATMKKEAQ